ncbi:Arylsulfatase [Planctomycetes bacterium CA13]|uniref:Arylsulfatase n=1 Tax=Novipirellula herctigrandis TaxID=2527986 RepID=A0A5C5YIK0_9BACT|nr:Arylsulfatase [Planctomycetes bacterium CA13]
MKSLATFFVLVSSILLGQACCADAPERPNIMIFLVDDMGMMDTSLPFLTDANGNAKRYPLNDYYRTPNMERLARLGIRFNHFYAMSVCSPTRISIMTGQNAARHRATNWINPQLNNRGNNGAPDWNWEGLKKGDVTLPSLMSESGYKTIHVGKAHFGPEDHEGAEPLNLGFDVNVAGAAFGAPGSYYAQQGYGNLTKNKRHAVPHLEKYHGSKTFLTEALTIEAKHQVAETIESGQPFCLYFAHYAVHAPFNSGKEKGKGVISAIPVLIRFVASFSGGLADGWLPTARFVRRFPRSILRCRKDDCEQRTLEPIAVLVGSVLR